MSRGSKAQLERFAQALADGTKPYGAAMISGYPNGSSARSGARKRAQRADVKEMVAAFKAPAQAAAAERLEITLQSLIERAEAAYQMAKEQKQPNAMVNAVREMAVLTGNRVEKKELGQAGQFDHLSDDELRRDVMERMELLRRSESSETQH